MSIASKTLQTATSAQWALPSTSLFVGEHGQALNVRHFKKESTCLL